ncbi:MAG: hypothetical protein ABW049_12905 [Spongiibacteraceae bacterium]
MNTIIPEITEKPDMNTTEKVSAKKSVVRVLCAALLCVGMSACDRKEGPAEQVGEKLDKAATDIGNAVEDKCEEAKESAGASDTRC